MKKIIYSVIVAFLLIGASSCKKEYTCVCENTTTGAELSRSIVTAYAGGGDSASENAQEECDAKESPFTPDRCEIQM